MSFLSALKGFGGWFAKVWQKVTAEAPKIEHIADTTLAYAVPALQIILGEVDPALVPVVSPIITEAQKDLHVASGLIFDFGATPTATSIINGVVSNLSGIEAAGHIKDTALQGKLNTVISTIQSLAQALETSLAPAPTA